MRQDFSRVAIVNRGEPARRFIHAVREYNFENGTEIRTLALFTDPDKDALFVREADEAFGLGPAMFVDERDGERKISYLNYAFLEQTLTEARAEAVWVGWGFVAEHPEFVDLCDRLGIVFIGPSAEVMRRLGDKISSKILAQKAGVPVVPWSGGAVEDLEEAKLKAQDLGYPLMIKATAGGGGRGIRKVDSEADLVVAFESARSEALKAFGNATVFLEKLLKDARHIEVQIIGDRHGTIWPIGVRDCTIQRRNQKVLEEAPSPALNPDQDLAVREAAATLGRALGYENAGTVEFLYEPESGEFWFLEVNARLQVEHPVTELTTGLDLVKLQLQVAHGGKLTGDLPATEGHAIEVRLNAEDPANQFTPAPGVVKLLRLPTGPGLRVDTGVTEGDEIPAEFDSMIAKLIAFGRTRNEALSRLTRALAEMAIIIQGGVSNKGFLLQLLGRQEVATSQLDVGWLDRLVLKGEHISALHAEVALMQAAIESYLNDLELQKAFFFTSAHRGRPQVNDECGHTVELAYQGNSYKFVVYRLDPDHFRIDVDGQHIVLGAKPVGNSEWCLTLGREKFRVLSMMKGHPNLVEVNGIPHRISFDDGGVIRAPAPAVVISIPVTVGNKVSVKDRLLVLEAMKMETTIVSHVDGTVKEILVNNNQQVASGAALLVIEPGDHQIESPGEAHTTRLSFDREPLVPFNGDTRSHCRLNMQSIRSLLLGFDAEPSEMQKMIDERGVLCRTMPADDSELWQHEDDVLNIFADINALFRRDPEIEEELIDSRRLSPEEYFFAYLRNVNAGEEGLPVSFLNRMKRALAHYGVHTLEAGPKQDFGLLRIFKSHQRMGQQIGPILSILHRRLENADQLAPYRNGEFRLLLERLIAVTQNSFPTVNDLAREVSFHYFDEPLLNLARGRAYETAEGHLTSLRNDPKAADRNDRIQALVECPQPIKPLLSKWHKNVTTEMHSVLLEVMTRRYYRIRELENIQPRLDPHLTALSAEYDYQGKRIHIFTCHADIDDLSNIAQSLNLLISQTPSDHDVGIDFYCWQSSPFTDPDEAQNHLRTIFDQVDFPQRVGRIVVDMSRTETNLGSVSAHIFTFRQTEKGFQEDQIYRGLHPMMGKRLQIWRMRNFEIERLLPSVEDVYIFKAVAKDNPKDERLFVAAEVRDLTRVRTDKHSRVQLPNLELMLQEALTGIRHFQSMRPQKNRFHWNRVLLYFRPPLDLKPDELQDIINRLAPATEGLNIEKVVAWARIPQQSSGELKETVIEISNPAGGGLVTRFLEPSDAPIETLSEYEKKVIRLNRRGLVYPYHLIEMLTPDAQKTQSGFPRGLFEEYDLNQDNQLLPVDRLPGENVANIVVGVIRNFTNRYPEGMMRVVLLGDPSKSMGSLAEPECRRIIAGLDLAAKLGVPLEWFAVSAGAKISMESGTENMDWIAKVLRRIVTYTQAGGEINIVVTGVNVGAQPYWNAEATMLMHTRGILIMTPTSSMVLTGKQALDYSGGVSAEDNQGIGGYERIMGPNGQAQYFARDIGEACRILLNYYEHSYVAPGERFPRKGVTQDPLDRDVQDYDHGLDFKVIGEIFREETNPGRKKPFDMRKVMAAVIDQDHPPLERWLGMEDAEIAIVWDAHLGGNPVCLLGFESRPIPRLGIVPADGPDYWTAGTLFPRSSKKIARAINAASSNRPLVVLANLSGFDGSPESLRKWQLEFGAEIGRAVVNFKGPIVFCVVSRYHGGAFVVFSNALNDNMEVAALEGTHASVIGGAPAAAVVFAREVHKRALMDERIQSLESEIAQAKDADKVKLRSQWNQLFKGVYSEKLGEIADEFDAIHSVQRAKRVGSVDRIIPPHQLRPYLINAVEKGMRRELHRIHPGNDRPKPEPEDDHKMKIQFTDVH